MNRFWRSLFPASPRVEAFERSARRPGGGYQPQSGPETAESRPTPPSGGATERPALRQEFARLPPIRGATRAVVRPGPPYCVVSESDEVTWCTRCMIAWPTGGEAMPCPLPPQSPPPQGLSDASLEQLFEAMLARLDPNPGREGIAETPARAAKAWRYWCSGYGEDVDALFKTFEDGSEGYDELVIVHNIPVLSHCEHHLAQISGIAHVGYIPDGRVVGLSKLARLVDTLSRRLQVQERLTVQIADAIERNLAPKGVGVIVRAEHACMSSRGVRIHGSTTTTSALRGCLHEGPARAEFLSLCEAAERKRDG